MMDLVTWLGLMPMWNVEWILDLATMTLQRETSDIKSDDDVAAFSNSKFGSY